jgi:hypothetical protein
MKMFWKKIPLSLRLTLLLPGGLLLIAVHFIFSQMLALIAGMTFILFAFFSLSDAEGRIYTEEDKRSLFHYPLLICVVAAAGGFFISGSIFTAVGFALATVGIYSLIRGKILLNFKGYKVYEGVYARVGSAIFLALGGFIVISFYTAAPVHLYAKPTGKWQGSYTVPAMAIDGCNSSHRIIVNEWNDDGHREYGQYSVTISSIVECNSDSVYGVPQYDDISAYAAEAGNNLFIWDGAVRDTLFVLERDHTRVGVARAGKRFTVADLKSEI